DAFADVKNLAARYGYIVAAVSYRQTQINLALNTPAHGLEQTPAAAFPAPLSDIKTAVQFIRLNAGGLIDPNRIGAWGWSAGGHLVAMLGASAGAPAPYEGRIAGVSSAVQAV